MIWDKYSDYLLYAITLIITLMISSNTNIFFQMITIDSIFSSTHFIKQYIDYRVTDSQIINESIPLYKHPILDRYIYYALSMLSYSTFCNFFWIKLIKLVYYGIIFTSIPTILNDILRTNLFNRIRKKKEHIIKIIISKQLGAIIEMSSNTYLDKQINVDHNELMILFDDYNSTLHHCLDIIKNLSIVLVTMYVKKYSTNFYYKMLKYVYSYKTGNELISFNDRTAKKRLTTIIEHKQWKDLLDPNMYKAIIHLYQLNECQDDFFTKLIQSFYYILGKTLTIWTISSFLNHILSVPILSIFMLFYRDNVFDCVMIKKILIILCGTLYGVYISNYLVTSIICQFGYNLIFNNLIYIILKYIKNETIKKLTDLNTTNADYILPILSTTGFVIIYGHLLSTNTLIVIGFDIIRNVIINTDKKRTVMYCTLLGTACLSNFNTFHIIHNAMIIYIMAAFLDYETTRQLIRFIKKKISNLSNVFIIMTTNKLKSNNKNKVIFDIWKNYDLYPSINKKNTVKNNILINNIEINNLNNQHVTQIIKPEFTKNNIFELDDANFIDAISIDSSFYVPEQIIKNSLILESVTYDNDARSEIIENFCL
jgi:hypothetical protein